MTAATVEMFSTRINDRWTLNLPAHRAARAEWATGWEVRRLDSMHRNIRPGDVVFDIGAEEGDLSALFAQWATVTGLGGGVVLMEPNSPVWPNISAIFEANDLDPPLAYFPGFASDFTDLAPPEYDTALGEDVDGWPACAYGPIIGDHGFRTIHERSHDTPQVTLDAFCEMRELVPDCLTMDVEGAELRVLRGAERVLRGARPLVWVSVHPAFMAENYGHADTDLHDFMADLGYEGRYLGTDHEQHWLFWPVERERPR